MLSSPWPFVVLTGCVVGDLADALVINAPTPGLESATYWQVERFLEAVAPLPVRVSEIRFEDLGAESLAGRFTSDGQVLIDEQLRGNRFVVTLRHEFCHALNSANRGLWRDNRALLEELTQLDGYSAPACDGRDACRLSEAFALACEIGPIATRALRYRCSDDPIDALSNAASYMLNSVWVGDPAIAVYPLEAVGELATGSPVTNVWGEGTSDPSVIRLHWQENGTPRERTVAVFTGESVVDKSLGPPPPTRAPVAFLGRRERQLAATDAAGVLDVRIDTDLAGPRRRRIWSDEQGAGRVLDGCQQAQAGYFTGGGEVLVAEPMEGGRGLHWRRLGWGPDF